MKDSMNNFIMFTKGHYKHLCETDDEYYVALATVLDELYIVNLIDINYPHLLQLTYQCVKEFMNEQDRERFTTGILSIISGGETIQLFTSTPYEITANIKLAIYNLMYIPKFKERDKFNFELTVSEELKEKITHNIKVYKEHHAKVK